MVPNLRLLLGFTLGVSDLTFLALFAATARHRSLRHLLPFLVLGRASVLLAMLAGLLLETVLPALPIVAVSFVLSNAILLYKSLADHRNT